MARFLQMVPDQTSNKVPLYQVIRALSSSMAAAEFIIILVLVHKALKCEWERVAGAGQRLAQHRQQCSNSHDRQSCGQKQTSRGTLKYFSLPGELQNQIMKLVLAPGQVYLPQMPATRYEFWLLVPRVFRSQKIW